MLNIHDIGRLKEDVKKDFTISKELTIVAGNLALKFGRFLAVANTALITMKHTTFANPEASSPQQFQNIPQQFRNNPEKFQANPEHSATIPEQASDKC